MEIFFSFTWDLVFVLFYFFNLTEANKTVLLVPICEYWNGKRISRRVFECPQTGLYFCMQNLFKRVGFSHFIFFLFFLILFFPLFFFLGLKVSEVVIWGFMNTVCFWISPNVQSSYQSIYGCSLTSFNFEPHSLSTKPVKFCAIFLLANYC